MARVLAETGWRTPAGITISSTTEPLGDAASVRHSLENALNTRPGMLLYLPNGRAVGYVDPPLEISVRSRQLTARALSPRGRLLLRAVHRALASCLPAQARTEDVVDAALPVTHGLFSEEERTRQVAVFNAIRAVVAAFAVPGDPLPGLYGAFGYDLIFHVEPIALRLPRPAAQRDLVLHPARRADRLRLQQRHGDPAPLHVRHRRGIHHRPAQPAAGGIGPKRDVRPAGRPAAPGRP